MQGTGLQGVYLGRDFSRAYAGTDWKRWVQRFSYFGTDESRKGLTLGLLGRHQLDNASMALACVEVLAAAGKFRFSDFQIRQALKEARWPGRFDLVSTRPRIILDGAHNAHGAAALRETLSECPYAKKNLIIAMNILKGKEYRKICRILSRLPEKVVIFGINNSRALEPGILMNEWGKYLKPDRIEYAGNIAGVLKKIRKTDTLCVTGSLYAVGEALAFFGRSQ
jgi:dihydrofolate synthase / folylpolyglutamate synthase